MLGIRFIKAPPTTYILHHANGAVKREGAGLSFFYYGPTSSLSLVPLGATDVPFAFNEATSDFQAVTLQGQLTFRVAEPRRLAELMDFSVGAGGQYVSEDPGALRDRLVAVTHVLAREAVVRFALRHALTAGEKIVAEVLPALRAAPAVTMMGVEVLQLSILSIRPVPEMARALEAEAREALQRSADQAIYARRNAAVEEERRIKESELQTEIAVEEKKKLIRETQMAADIAVEEQRTALIDRRVDNERKDADSRAYALDAVLKPVKDVDWRTLMAVAPGGADPKLMIALAFRELAENAQKIGELNITPDLLKSLLGSPGK
jgi:regulator of protease activity HflC (stomatin/prohibitin superfamily)